MKLSKDMKWAVGIMCLFMAGIIICIQAGQSVLWAMACAVLVALCAPVQTEWSIRQRAIHVWSEGMDFLPLYGIIALVGVSVGLWIASGVVPMLIDFGFLALERVPFLPFAFLLTAVLAFFMGTGLGTISTVGVALFAVARGTGIPSAVVVGALVSGAYVADRLSPISALVNLTLKTVDIPYKAYYKGVLRGMLPSIGIALGVYFLLGRHLGAPVSEVTILGYRRALQITFQLNPVLLLMPLCILSLSVKGVRTHMILIAGCVMGGFFAIVLQGLSLQEVILTAARGVRLPQAAEFVQSLEIGGMLTMLEVVGIVMGGVALNALYTLYGWFDPLKKPHLKTAQGCVVYTACISTLLNALTCDQSVGILVPGKQFQDKYRTHHLPPEALAQTIALTGTGLAPIMPWNVNALIIYEITGVSAGLFAGFALLNWLPALIGIWGLTRLRKKGYTERSVV